MHAVSHAVIRLRRVQRSQLFALFWPIRLQLPLIVTDSVTGHAHEYVYLSTLRSSVSHLFSKFGNNCSERNIT